MNIKYKLIRAIEHPSGIIDLAFGFKPAFVHYFLTVKKLSPEINTYIDVGANKGELIKACKRVFPNAIIYAIEPIKEQGEYLKKQFPDTSIFNCGLWNINKKSKFYYVRERDGVESSFLKPTEVLKEKLEEREVEVRRFDSMPIEIKRPCFVKIDVEGAENRVLEGMGNRLKEVDFVQLEQTHIIKNEGKGMMSRNIQLLESFGFTGFLQVNTTYYPDGYPMKSDLIFFRDTRKNRLG